MLKPLAEWLVAGVLGLTQVGIDIDIGIGLLRRRGS